MMTMEERYYRDPMFKAIVDHLESLFLEAKMTPTEVREAAYLAQVHYEIKHPREFLPFTRETLDRIDRENALNQRLKVRTP